MERILIVDDDPVVRDLIKETLTNTGYECMEAENAQELFARMSGYRFSLILLDIKLPDQDGISLLPWIMEQDEDICVVVITGITDVKTAVSAIRGGAHDYITKPFSIDELSVVVSRSLNKRRLEIENKRYQKSIEERNLRLEILHDLSVKMAYHLLSTVELEDIFRTVLAGITAGEGLGLDRAFLALFDDENNVLRGKMAVGPDSAEEVGRIWSKKKYKLTPSPNQNRCPPASKDKKVEQIINKIVVSNTDTDHLLIRSVRERRPFNIVGGRVNGQRIKKEVINLLGVDTFVVVPLCSPSRVQGVIVADNFLTGKPIQEEDIAVIELFANQASLAIEKSKLYSELAAKIAMLETANKELKESQELLIRAERFSAIGEMAAQIAHEMRNPLASLGGLARFVQRHSGRSKHKKHLENIVKQTERMEEVLAQVFSFIQQPQPILRKRNLNAIISSCINLLNPLLDKSNIKLEMDLATDMPYSYLDGDLIKQAVINICKNAIDAMPSGGKLRVRTKVTAQDIKVEIRDTGIGMNKETLNKAREPFFTTKTYGIGLGLNIAEKIIKDHKGKMNISGTLGSGVQVSISLPRAKKGILRQTAPDS